MGTLGCKYCVKENGEEQFEQAMKNNPPFLITNEKDRKNIENNNINDFNNNKNCNNINISVEKEKDKIILNENNIMVQNDEINNNINNVSNSNDNTIENNNKLDFIFEENKENILKKGNFRYNLKETNINKFSIKNQKEAKNKIKNFEINKIQFGIKKEDKETFNQEQKKLYKEAESNLQQFDAPQGAEITKLQTLMSNILLKLNKIFNSIDFSSKSDDLKYILLNASLKKMVNYEIKAHKTVLYSERFCVLYPKIFKYYKSKEQFLKNLSPICVLPIDQISAINIAKPKKNKNKKYHLIICNKLGIQRDFNNSIFLNAFDSSEINNYISSPDANESLLIFTSDNEKELLHWYIVIQYIIEFSKI